MDPLLEMRSITKDFSGVKALAGVSFDILNPEIHALCGENGAGKSTLMKVLSGYYTQYGGEIVLDGKVQHFRSIRESEESGISIIHQELSLIPEMSIGENIFLGREPSRWGVIDWDEIFSRTRDVLKVLGLRVNPQEKIKFLGIGQQQMVEIAKALVQKPRLLVLDEPSSALTKSETQNLLSLMKKLRDESSVSCVLITHKLNEVFEVADRITVLRDGRTVATHKASEVNEAQLISAMVGREVKDLYPRISRERGRTAFEVKNLSALNPRVEEKMLLKNISFSVREGEILGIAGLMGAGRTELLAAIFGAHPGKVTGTLSLFGKPLKVSSPEQAIAAGLSLLTEDRKRYGLILDDTVERNITLSSLNRVSLFGLIRGSSEFLEADKYRLKLRVKTGSLQTQVKNLSGGNQQKVVLAKCLMSRPKVLFLDEPTRGVDVGAKAEIYQLIQELAAQKIAIVMVSSELPEVLGVSDRILVMSDGRVTAELESSKTNQEQIMTAAVS